MPFSERSYRERMEEQLDLEKFFLEKVFENIESQIIDFLGQCGLNHQQSKLTYGGLLLRYKSILEVVSLSVSNKAPGVEFFDTAFETILESFFGVLKMRSPFPPAREGEADPLDLFKKMLCASYNDLRTTLQKKTQQGLDRKPDVITPFPSAAKK